MSHFRTIVAAALILWSAWALIATLTGMGGEELEHPEGVSIRQESVQPGEGFFVVYGRSHMGGGLADGK